MRKEDLIQNPDNYRPHVVLLGAGASRAAFSDGDANGRKLPVMNDMVGIIGLQSFLSKAGVNPSGNFETIYGELSNDLVKAQIEEYVFNYFNSLVLPSSVTIYDKLLLSLRKDDVVLTFNWDPFLYDAYERNENVASLPRVYFLHGNVRIGSCKICGEWGKRVGACSICKVRYDDVPLLYPVEKKEYFELSKYTAMSWDMAQKMIANALILTIFGYGAPKSDTEAVELLRKAWFAKSRREIERVEVVDILSTEVIYETWKSFTPTHHLDHKSKFEDSFIWLYPRRSREAIIYPSTQGIACERFPLDETSNLEDLQNAIREIAEYEE